MGRWIDLGCEGVMLVWTGEALVFEREGAQLIDLN